MTSSNREKYGKRYERGCYTIERMKKFVATNELTPEEFTEITGQPYV